ncbi:MAG: T9SS type A sorting domain-containing protein [Prevotella sp.]|nr:T9SS type A sorting domain-containing protein [Prevotella sp.]
MKSYIKTILTLLIAILSQAGHAENVLYINQKGQEPVKVMLSEKPEVTFDATSVKISTPAMTILYEDLESFTFGNEGVNPTEIDIEGKQYVQFSLVGDNNVSLSGLESGNSLRLFSLDGKALPVSATRNNNEIILHLGNLPSGVYIVKTDHQSFKIIKK